MKNKIVVLYGSPREAGNSDTLGQAFVKGAREAGCEVSEIYIRNLRINGCLGCESCYSKHGECAQKDDMIKIYDQLYASDVIVFSTPIYYQGFPAQLKAVVDRFYISENKPFTIKKAFLIATYATPGKRMGNETRRYFEILCKYHEWYNVGALLVSGLDDKDDVLRHKQAIAEAETWGKTIIDYGD